MGWVRARWNFELFGCTYVRHPHCVKEQHVRSWAACVACDAVTLQQITQLMKYLGEMSYCLCRGFEVHRHPSGSAVALLHGWGGRGTEEGGKGAGLGGEPSGAAPAGGCSAACWAGAMVSEGSGDRGDWSAHT